MDGRLIYLYLPISIDVTCAFRALRQAVGILLAAFPRLRMPFAQEI